MATPLRDPQTAAYFDEHVPEYSVERLRYAADWIGEHKRPDSSIVDVGCGAGNTLAFLRGTTGIESVVGIDVSEKCLKQTRERLGCTTYLGSILDRDVVARVGHDFDFAIVSAVLHHLIGRSRRGSRLYVVTAIVNSLALLRPGGHLLVLEPTFRPRLAMDALFYVKKLVSSFTATRVPLFVSWNNIGAPVVSYYEASEVRAMLEAAGSTVVAEWSEGERRRSLVSAALRKRDITLAASKPDLGK